MEKACAVTGHRPTRFKFKYNENYTLCKKLKKVIFEQFKKMYDEQEVRHIYIGGMLGVDIWAGEIALRLKEMPGYGDLQLHLVLPFEGYDEKWDKRSRERLAFLIRHSAECVTIGKDNSGESYFARNRYLVNHADMLLAVFDNEKTVRSGTLNTVNDARKKQIPILLIHPDTARVSDG